MLYQRGVGLGPAKAQPQFVVKRQLMAGAEARSLIYGRVLPWASWEQQSAWSFLFENFVSRRQFWTYAEFLDLVREYALTHGREDYTGSAADYQVLHRLRMYVWQKAQEEGRYGQVHQNPGYSHPGVGVGTVKHAIRA